MIDLHCHILSGVDDGARTITDSINMAKLAMQEGIHTIVATPHHQNGIYINTASRIVQQVKQLNTILKEQELNITVLPGQEVRLYDGLLEDLEKKKIVTLNQTNRFVLIEFASNFVPHYAEKMLYKLQLKGIVPIIVHPERNMEFVKNPQKLYKLVNQGALTQTTASSLVGHFGKKIKKFSLQLIEHNLTHVIASDAHNITTRAFHLQTGYEVIEKEFGISVAFNFKENAYLVIGGKEVYRDEPEMIRHKKLFSFF
ncbi:tyrosine-protein phosphatase [Bacillus sp. C1]